MKCKEEIQANIVRYIDLRKPFARSIKGGTATEDDLTELEQKRDLTVKAREAGATGPSFK